MKLSNVLVIATVTAALVSFQYGQKEKSNDVVVYNLDKSGSNLERGNKLLSPSSQYLS